MWHSIEESLLQAIKKDDIKAFNTLMEKAQCGSYRLGRFPVLSLLYLYNAKLILAVYEEKFIKIPNFEEIGEPVEVSKKFASKAGKCLRLYLNDIVFPLEMLLILDKTRRLKRIYPQAKPSAAVKERLKSIYSIKYSLNIRFEGDNIIIDRRPLSYREKRNIFAICLCSVLAVSVAVAVPVAIPKPVEGEVTKLSQINFKSDKEYTLKRDISLPKNYSVPQVNCKINGGGKKLVLGKGATLGELNGKLSDVTIESYGDTIFTTVTQSAVIENVTVNVSSSLTADKSAAFIAQTNYGTIDGVTLNVSGRINALTPSSGNSLTFGGIVQTNSFTKFNGNTYLAAVQNCTVNYSDFELAGEVEANSSFGGVAGVNSGYLQGCSVSGKITANTFDLAGVCSVNGGILSGCVNGATLSQTSSDTGWNPLACGIVLENYYAVENCVNRGAITSVSDCGQFVAENEPQIFAAGIAGYSRDSSPYPNIKNCANYGNIDCRAEYRNAYVGGICAIASGNIENCLNGGDITVEAPLVYVGGILGYGQVTSDGFAIYFDIVNLCISKGDIEVTATGEERAFVGGIAGNLQQVRVNWYDESVTYESGAVTNCYFEGGCQVTNSYFGNIVGVCGANVYESNSYTSGNNRFDRFTNNCYLENSSTAFGAVATDGEEDEDEEFLPAGDKNADEVTPAQKVTLEDMHEQENYKKILASLPTV